METATLTKKIEEQIAESTPGTAFSSIDYSHIADLNTVHQILTRLEKSGKIKRIMQGIYYIPRYSELLKEYEEPSPNEIAMAISRKNRWFIIPDGDTALNQLGLSTQIPSKWTYISSGPYANFKYKNITLDFKRRSTKQLYGMSEKTAIVIQALKALGKDNVTEDDLKKIASRMTDEEKQKLLDESRYTISWIYKCVKKICELEKLER